MWYTVPTLHNTVSAVGKESFMKRQQEEFTALYCRLSQDDGREGESNSIVNQKEYLMKCINGRAGQRNVRSTISEGTH